MNNYINFFYFLKQKRKIDIPFPIRLMGGEDLSDEENITYKNRDTSIVKISNKEFSLNKEIKLPQNLSIIYCSVFFQKLNIKDISNVFVTDNFYIVECKNLFKFSNITCGTGSIILINNPSLKEISNIKCKELKISNCNSLQTISNLVVEKIILNENDKETFNLIPGELKNKISYQKIK